ncbi:regulator of volume decrease after cellular swelling-domain-containing protein [Talaromyces proteolyticus]|uniref:Regulator of volume decrease after cellular swelling-domain-containing protein n=1 Tax=Talaromyces proteolyticus TaxID=1131652 RepID=A0AAD4KXU2_9EURO|nr:regulator of volume decrease after cellular swelling-domain-containing protein [Talaromyces proteolyticus]KAH8701793.1 regulator of volume decrease after cellular swelling-domain-containing protein [Talaromyces proteolyticus]
MEVLQTPPQANSFTPLAEHQSRTPQSFYDGAPVLHYHSTRCKVVILESELTRSPALRTLRGTASETNGASGAAHDASEEKEIAVDGVDIWVASDKFFLYRPDAGAGVAIPYPLISLHAIQRLRLPDTPEGAGEVQGLYMQIANPTTADNTGAEEDEEEDSINLTVVPPSTAEAASAALGSYSAGTETAALASDEMAAEAGVDIKPEETTTQALYQAVSACSNLHPDPIAPGEGDDDDAYEGTEQPGVGDLLQAGLIVPGAADGGLPPPMHGSSGWITADNIGEYFDEEGNWIGEGEPPTLPGLGPGAGNVHDRDDGEVGENGEVDDETKWRRTD